MRQHRSGGVGTALATGAVLVLISFGATQAAAGHARAGDRPPAWATHLVQVDVALARNDADAALRAWHDAYIAALGIRCWEGLIATGDAYRRIGRAAGFQRVADIRARHHYLVAFYRARALNSLDGVLLVAEAFATLGDDDAVAHALRAAERLAPDVEGRERVQKARTRLAPRRLAAQSPSISEF